jgi:hypothetical protein
MEKVEVTIQSDGKPVPIAHFASYFFWLRATYALALEQYEFELDENSGDVVVKDITAQELSTIVMFEAASLSSSKIHQLAYKFLPPEEDLFLDDISRENPFDVVFMGIGVALAAALIVSGGKFEITPVKIKIEIPALGEGISKIMQAFGQKKK